MLIDETGAMLNPLVRRTWARKGQTPVIPSDGGHRKKVSVIGALSLSHPGRRLGFYFRTLPDGYFNAPEVSAFLRDLLRHLRGDVVVLWDGGPSHKGPAIRQLLAAYPRLTLERLPAYTPDLNPVEWAWSWLKYGKMANSPSLSVAEVEGKVTEHLIDLKHDPQLLRKLWDGSDLPFPHTTT